MNEFVGFRVICDSDNRVLRAFAFQRALNGLEFPFYITMPLGAGQPLKISDVLVESIAGYLPGTWYVKFEKPQ